MANKISLVHHSLIGSLLCVLMGCYHPPYNHFQKQKHNTLARAAVGAGVGAGVGALAGNALVGLAVGGTAGTVSGLYKEKRSTIIQALQQQDIQFVQYGDTNTLIIPTDKYFKFNSPELDDLCYPGLYNIVRLLHLYPNHTFYIAAFTDNIGSKQHKKKLSQAQAEAMLTYLWANNISPAQCLSAEGYADKHPVGDNALIHGSAHNRRIEIQWYKQRLANVSPPPYWKLTKFGLNK